MRELALFAGAGGGLLAGALIGWRCICAVEIDGYRRRVLELRQCENALPAFPIWDDVRTFDGTAWRGHVDVVSGGFPCQAHSSAARGRNVADDLWPEMRRIVAETAPRYIFAENTTRKAIDAAADDLEQMGYETRCIALSAADLGGDHVRPRYWLRAHAHGDCELRRPEHAKMARVQELCQSVWRTEPAGARVPNGLARRVERLSATGDGQVPVVAAAAWELMG